jgi:hypothetical protein
MTSTKPGSGDLRPENAVDYVISLVGIVLGRGKRLFAETSDLARLRLVRSEDGAGVVHLRYAVDHAADAGR